MILILDELEKSIRRYYEGHAHLMAVYKQVIQPVARANQPLLTQLGVEYNERKSIDEYTLKIISAFFYHDALRALFLKNLPPITLKMCAHVTWWGDTDKKVAEELAGFPLLKKVDETWPSYNIVPCIHPDFRLFNFYVGDSFFRKNSKIEYQVYLPDMVRALFKKSFTMPIEGQLKFGNTLQQVGVDENTQVFENEKNILNELSLCEIFRQQKLLQLSQQGKPNKSTLKKLQSTIECKEFYPSKVMPELNFMHTHFLALVIEMLKQKNSLVKGDTESGLALLKGVYQRLSDGNGFSILDHLLVHLKGRHLAIKYDGNDETHLHNQLFQLLKPLPPLQWVNFANWEQHIFLADTDVLIVSPRRANRYLHFDISAPDYSDVLYLSSESIVHQAVTIPVLKSVLFLYASLGWVDIAYGDPTNDQYQLRHKPYLSLYDGLQCFRLTTLGAFILGQSKDYAIEAPASTHARVILDADRLLITFHGQDKLKATVLKQMTHQIGDNRYKMDYESLLMGCASVSDIEQKMVQFKRQIAEKPPKNWQAFFKQVLLNSEPLKQKTTLQVFELSKQPELYHLIASDPILKKYVFKAEAYHLVIEKKHLSQVKKRLSSLGYFMP